MRHRNKIYSLFAIISLSWMTMPVTAFQLLHVDRYRTTIPQSVPQALESSRSNVQRKQVPYFRMIPPASVDIQTNSYYLTRIVFVRALSFVYAVTFLIAKHQAKALIGDNGIVPARTVLDRAEARAKLRRDRRQTWLESSMSKKSPVTIQVENEGALRWQQQILANSTIRRLVRAMSRNKFFQHWRERLWDRQDDRGFPVTTLLWLAKDRSKLNPWLEGISNGGLAMSIFAIMKGSANFPLLLGLWVCQRSLMAVGGPFWGFGWEPQLAELGFHALFLVPLWSLDPLGAGSPPSSIVLYTIRWHLFRIMIGAGLIKLRSSDTKWKMKNLSAMNYFYQTQPVPNPFTRYFHWMPKWWHKFEVLMNHFVELVSPWLLLFPLTLLRRTGAAIQIAFQVILILSGNLSFLNWLTMVPAISCLDDRSLAFLFSSSWIEKARQAASKGQCSPIGQGVSLLFAVWMCYLSIPVVKNLLSKNQIMNGSFGPLRLVNTYGAFGSVDEDRYEFIVSGASSYEGPWKEYEFKVKPGDVTRKPRFISPYHYRIDWQFWIACTVGDLHYSPWIFSFLLKVLEGDADVLNLLATNPFEGSSEVPKYIRLDKYRYEFKRSSHSEKTPDTIYWKREFISRVYPRQGVASAETLRELL